MRVDIYVETFVFIADLYMFRKTRSIRLCRVKNLSLQQTASGISRDRYFVTGPEIDINDQLILGSYKHELDFA